MNLDLLSESPWVLWTVMALTLAILEVGVPVFAFLFASIAAMITALVSLSFGWPIQLVIFIFSTLLSVVILRPRLLNRWQRNHSMPSRAQALVGAQGVVSETVDPIVGTGRVMVEGQDWAAKSQSLISIGKTIKVEKHDGIVLIIKEI